MLNIWILFFNFRFVFLFNYIFIGCFKIKTFSWTLIILKILIVFVRISSFWAYNIIIFFNFLVFTRLKSKFIFNILYLNDIMVNEYCGRDIRLIRNLGFSIKKLFPAMCSLQRLWVWSVGYNYTASYMPNIQWLKCGLWIHIWALVPQLDPYFLTIDVKDFETKVGTNFLFIL
jgi:hypothetical protein